MTRIGRVVGETQRDAPLVAKHDVDVFRRDALRLRQKIGIERQLQHVLGIG